MRGAKRPRLDPRNGRREGGGEGPLPPRAIEKGWPGPSLALLGDEHLEGMRLGESNDFLYITEGLDWEKWVGLWGTPIKLKVLVRGAGTVLVTTDP